MNVEYIAGLHTSSGLAYFSQKTTLPFVPQLRDVFLFRPVIPCDFAGDFICAVQGVCWRDYDQTLCVTLDVSVDINLPLKLLVEMLNSVGFITSSHLGGISLPGDDIGLAEAYQNERKRNKH